MMEMVNGQPVRGGHHGPGHPPPVVPRGGHLRGPPQPVRQPDRPYPLVRETLVDLLVDLEAGMAATYECAAAERRSRDRRRPAACVRRILIPLAKMRCTRMALWAASTALEVFGGNGYMNDWPMARQLRDAQCHTIWEGTENILCTRRPPGHAGRTGPPGAAGPMEQALDAAFGHKVLATTVDTVAAALADAARSHRPPGRGRRRSGACSTARRLAELLADVSEGAFLLEEAAWSLEGTGNARKAVVAHRFANQNLRHARARGLLDTDRTVLDHFEPLVRYGELEPGDLAA